MADLLADGKLIGKFTDKNLTVNNVTNRTVRVQPSGAGALYYFWQAQGVRARGRVAEEDHYLKVRRYFATRDGKPLTNNTFQQNNLVLVVIALQSGDAAGEVRNVAITDLLPAGLEIENPRLGAQRDLPALANLAQPDYLDVRDDRLNLFTTATPRPKTFAYLARAVSRGTFQLGPVSAEAMCNAEYRSVSGAGVVRVR